MASNFKVSLHRKGDVLQLKLMGDFDAASAFDLLNVLGKSGKGINRIIIHTSGLKQIYPFGCALFQKNLHFLVDKHIRFEFTGKNATQMSLR